MLSLTPERIAAAAKQLPTGPQTFSKLERMLKDPMRSLGDVTPLLRADLALSAAVLRLANSAAYAGARPATSLEEAINRVGFREVHKLVALAASSQLFQKNLTFYRLTAAQVFDNAMATAVAAEWLARKVQQDAQVAYTAGLLRSLGKIVINLICEKEGPAAGVVAFSGGHGGLAAWERTSFQVSNADVAAQLLKSWTFPEATIGPIRLQYDPLKGPAPAPLAGVVHLGGWVAARLNRALPAEDHFGTAPPSLLASLRLKEAVLNEAVIEARAELNRLQESLRAAA